MHLKRQKIKKKKFNIKLIKINLLLKYSNFVIRKLRLIIT